MSRLLLLLFIVVGGSVAVCGQSSLNSAVAATSLSSLIEATPRGDTLYPPAGNYQVEEVIRITRPIAIMGRGEVILTAAPGVGLLEIRADSVTIDGLILRDVYRSYTEDLSAVWLNQVEHFSITNNRIENCFFALFGTRAARGLLADNVIIGNAVDEYSSGNAIHLWYCDSMQIIGNAVSNHRDGIYLEFTDNSYLEGNDSRDNLRYGLHFMFSDNDTYRNNIFQNNGAGVAVMFSRNIDMEHNRFQENWGSAAYGLLLKEIYDSKITGNVFYKNTTGILAEGSTRVRYFQNQFTGNGWAIKMRGSSIDNELLYNRFEGNTFHMAAERSTSENNLHHNYWDDYDGYDLDHDGVGDIPHRPVNLFSHLIARSDASILLLRSSFIEVLNLAERIAPAVTPENLEDPQPLIKAPHYDTF